MAYHESLVAKVRQSFAGRPNVEEKRMFGGLTFMVGGNMCCGVHRDDLIIRLDAGIALEDLNSPQVREWDFMKRPMRGIFAVSAPGSSTQKMVDRWVELALRHARSLPPKPRSGAKPRRQQPR
jgi:TfoX/Sxy family transcriptional regulator of competence genes